MQIFQTIALTLALAHLGSALECYECLITDTSCSTTTTTKGDKVKCDGGKVCWSFKLEKNGQTLLSAGCNQKRGNAKIGCNENYDNGLGAPGTFCQCKDKDFCNDASGSSQKLASIFTIAVVFIGVALFSNWKY